MIFEELLIALWQLKLTKPRRTCILLFVTLKGALFLKLATFPPSTTPQLPLSTIFFAFTVYSTLPEELLTFITPVISVPKYWKRLSSVYTTLYKVHYLQTWAQIFYHELQWCQNIGIVSFSFSRVPSVFRLSVFRLSVFRWSVFLVFMYVHFLWLSSNTQFR